MLPSDRSNKSDANMQVIVKNSEVILNFKLNWSSSYSDIIGFLHFVVCGLMLRLEKAIGGLLIWTDHVGWYRDTIWLKRLRLQLEIIFHQGLCHVIEGITNLCRLLKAQFPTFQSSRYHLHCRCELWKFVQRFALRQWNGINSCLMFYCRNTQAAKVCITSKM